MILSDSYFKPSNPHEISCGFWDMENRWWSDEGCVLNLAQSNGTETVCDCFHLTPFSLFMDWTGECFGLPSSPALDIITRVRILFLGVLVKLIAYTEGGLQVFLGMSLLCLFFVEGCNYCKQDPATEKFTLYQISRSHRRTAQRFCNL